MYHMHPGENLEILLAYLDADWLTPHDDHERAQLIEEAYQMLGKTAIQPEIPDNIILGYD